MGYSLRAGLIVRDLGISRLEVQPVRSSSRFQPSLQFGYNHEEASACRRTMIRNSSHRAADRAAVPPRSAYAAPCKPNSGIRQKARTTVRDMPSAPARKSSREDPMLGRALAGAAPSAAANGTKASTAMMLPWPAYSWAG